jgi:hypothetical protein
MIGPGRRRSCSGKERDHSLVYKQSLEARGSEQDE